MLCLEDLICVETYMVIPATFRLNVQVSLCEEELSGLYQTKPEMNSRVYTSAFYLEDFLCSAEHRAIVCCLPLGQVVINMESSSCQGQSIGLYQTKPEINSRP